MDGSTKRKPGRVEFHPRSASLAFAPFSIPFGLADLSPIGPINPSVPNVAFKQLDARATHRTTLLRIPEPCIMSPLGRSIELFGHCRASSRYPGMHVPPDIPEELVPDGVLRSAD